MPLVVGEADDQGRAVSLDVYDVDQLDQARARFDEIREKAKDDPRAAVAKPNAASTFLESFKTADRHDWETVREAFVPGFRLEDRRRLFRLAGGFDLMMASLRERERSGLRQESVRLIGTAGDRVAVGQILWAEGPPDGRVEIEILRLIEVDEEGRCVAVLLFDLEDAGEAQREAWARWVAAEPAVAPLVTVLSEHVDGWNEKDRDRLLLACAPDIIVEDHRRTGMGRLEGAEAYVESVAALWELAPDSIIEAGWFWLAVEPHGAVVAGRRFGRLADGGDFESDFLALFTVADGRSTRLELFEIDDVDTALARFEALR